MPSRGDAISAYSAAFAKGAKIYNNNIKAAFLSGTISGLANGAPVGVDHNLGVKPKLVVACMLATAGEITAKHTIHPSAVSASTSAKIFLVSSKTGNVKYAAYVQV